MRNKTLLTLALVAGVAIAGWYVYKKTKTPVASTGGNTTPTIPTTPDSTGIVNDAQDLWNDLSNLWT